MYMHTYKNLYVHLSLQTFFIVIYRQCGHKNQHCMVTISFKPQLIVRPCVTTPFVCSTSRLLEIKRNGRRQKPALP